MKHHLYDTIDWDQFKLFQVDRSFKNSITKESNVNSKLNNHEADKIAADILQIINISTS